MNKMTVHITCPQCQSGIHIYPDSLVQTAQCDICSHQVDLTFDGHHESGVVEDCPICGKKDFYIQKDFNRKIGVLLFLLASVLSIFTYGLSFLALYALDFFLFKKLNSVIICYKCQTIFRNAHNVQMIPEFNHEMHDRIVYAGHDFQGKSLVSKY